MNFLSILDSKMRPRGNEFGVFPKNIHGSYIYYFWVYEPNGKRKFRTTGKRNIDDAVKFCRNLQVQGRLHNKTSLSFSSYAKDFFDFDKCPYINHRVLRGHTYTRSWVKRQKKLLDGVIMPYFAQKNINSITFNDLDVFIMSLKKRDFSHKKINHVITTLKNVFSFSEMSGVIMNNPCKGIKSFKIISPEKGIFTNKELHLLFDEENRGHIWPETMYYIINFLAVSTGLRLGELLALKPKDITDDLLKVSHSFNADDGLKSTKNGKTRVVRLNEKLVTLLTDFCREKQLDDFIFSINNGKSPIDHKSIYKRFWKALEKIGINKEERKRRNITFHSYRHLVNSLLLQAGMPPETVRLLLGHSGSAMTARYSHIQLPVPDIFGMQEKPTTCSEKNENKNIKIPSFVEKLIDKGVLYKDGKTVAKSLNDVALEMQKIGTQPTEGLLRKHFNKRNGENYSLKACKQAVVYANSK
jgi:integrase